MLRPFLRAKIHRATVTGADLHYVGSITLDADLMAAAGIDHLEKVEVYDITNGARLSTYALRGPAGSGRIEINGAAAHLVKPGDLVIVCAYALVADDELAGYAAKVVIVDADNRIADVREQTPADELDEG